MDHTVVWVARAATIDVQYLAIFNVGEDTVELKYELRDLGFEASSYGLRDLWALPDFGIVRTIAVTVPAHGVALYKSFPGKRPWCTQ